MGLDRRAFIGLVAGGAVGTLFTPIPWKITDDLSIWSQNWSWIPRVPKGPVGYAYTTSKLCPSGTGLKVMTVAGNPITAAGNPDHPLSQGGASSIGRSEAYMLYSPARVRTPMQKVNGKFEPITWEQAQTVLEEKCKAAGAKIACISGDETGTANEALSAFIKKMGSSAYYMMPGEKAAAAKAWGLMGGTGQVGFDVDNADCVLILGADMFETWGASVRNRKAYSAARPTGGNKASYIFAGPERNSTGSICDAWIPAKPGELAMVALGIAWHLMKAGAAPMGAGASEFAAFVEANCSPDKIEKACGLKADVLAAAAKKLAGAKAPLVVAGSGIAQGGSAATFIAGMALNMLLGRINKPGGVMAMPALPKTIDGAMDCAEILDNDLIAFLKDAAAGKTPEALLVYEANPAYGLPEADAMAEALGKIPFKATFASFMDETAAMCDLVLPNSLTLERFDDVATPYGVAFQVYSLVKPLTKPIFDTRTSADFVLALADKMGMSLGFESMEAVLKAKAEALAAAGGFIAKDVQPWEVIAGKSAPAPGDLWADLEAGYAWAMVATEDQAGLGFGADILAKAVKPQEGKVILAPYARQTNGTPVMGIPSQNLTIVPDNELLDMTTFVKMNVETASWFGVSEGSPVTIEGAGQKIQARVHLSENVMTGVIAAPLGFGHTAFDQYSKGKGVNVFRVLSTRVEEGAEMTVWDGAAVNIA